MSEVMRGRKKRVLFADDDPLLLRALENAMRPQREVWDLVFVPGGPAALAQLRTGEFDAIVTDWQMPELDGATLLAIVAHEWPHIVRVMVTASAIDGHHIQAHAILAKPVDTRELIATVHRRLHEVAR